MLQSLMVGPGRVTGIGAAVMCAAVLGLLSASAWATPAFLESEPVLKFDATAGNRAAPGADASDLGIDGNAPRTIEAWVRVTEFTDGGAPFSMGSQRARGDFTLRTAGSADAWLMQLWGGGADVSFTHPSQDRWVHWAMVHTGERTIVYADGEPVAERGGELDTGTEFPLQIGNWHHPRFEQFSGMLSEVRVWSAARSQAQIRRQMGERLSGDEAGLVAYWPLNEGEGQQARDHAGERHASLTRVAWYDGGQEQWVEGFSDEMIQGEYAADGWGAQIIDRSGGNFEGYLLGGGLPGAGWDGEQRVHVQGRRGTDSAVLRNDELELRIEEGELFVYEADGTMKARLPRVERVSSRFGVEPPEDAIVLFGGPEDVEHWEGGEVDEQGLLKQGVTSHRTFGDHFIHVAFKLPYMPAASDMGRSNSGIYVQGRYEIQMLDSFGEAPTPRYNAAIFGVHAVDVNMSYPPLRWQTYDIDYTAARFNDEGEKVANARMTVWHNGVKVHDDVEIPGITNAAPISTESDEPGPVYLQDHGSSVRYSHVWVVEK